VAGALIVGGLASGFLDAPALAAKSRAGITLPAATTNDTAFGSGVPIQVTTSTPGPLAWTVSIASRCAQVRTLTGQQGAAGPLSIAWDGLTDAAQPAPPGNYTLTLTGSSGADTVAPLIAYARINAAAGSPADPCGAPDQFKVTGAGFGHGVGMSQWGAYGMANEGADASTIVTHYFAGSTVQPVQDDMNIRVNLLYHVNQAKFRSEPLEAGGGAIELTIGETIVTGGPSDTFTAELAGDGVRVIRSTGGASTDLGTAPKIGVRWAGTRTPGSAAGGATLLNITGPKGTLASPGHRYRYGSIEIAPVNSDSGRTLNVINALRLHEEYLYGISEVSSSWPLAALQAQVIAARSYALSKINAGVRKPCSCHLDDGKGPYTDQTFSGWSKASGAKGDNWVAAVNGTLASETTGLALLDAAGKPIKAFYTASTGGLTTSSKDQWGGELPYAQVVDDRWSLNAPNPERSWTISVSQPRMAQIFGVGQVVSVNITDRVSSGAIKQVTATLPDGRTVTKGGTSFMSALGAKSRYIQAIDGQVGIPLPTIAPTVITPAMPANPDAAPAVPGTDVPAAPAPTTPTVSVSLAAGPTTSPKAGSSVVFSGALSTGKKGLRVERQILENDVWHTKAKTQTKAKGKFRFTIKKAVPAGAVYQYRVVVFKKKQVIAVSEPTTITVTP
jgi:SpoIID/LytB domain protein